MFRTVYWPLGRLLVGTGLLAMSACGGHDHGYEVVGPPPGPQANFQVLNASPDAPPVNVLIDGALVVPHLDYGAGTGEQSIGAAAHTITLQALTPGQPTTVIGPTNVDFPENTDQVIVAEGPEATVSALVFGHPLSQVAAGSTRVEFLHAAPKAPPITVYLTAPGAALSSSAVFGSLAFTGSLGPSDIPAGQYEIRVTPSGSDTPVLFDSGTLTFGGGTDLVIAALQNTFPATDFGTSNVRVAPPPITLSIVDALGNNSRIVDVATPTNLRVVHDSPDAPPVSAILDGQVSSPLVASLAYPNFTAYLSVTAGAHTLAITPAGNAGDDLIEKSLLLNAGTEHTLYAMGPLADITAVVTTDDRRRLATQAKLRLVHGSPSAGDVDIYITAPGSSLATQNPTYAHVPFTADTGFQSFAAGTYDITVTAAGSKTPAIGPVSVSLVNTGIYTAVARDAIGGGTPLGLILLDDFATQ